MIGDRKVVDCFLFNNELDMLNLRLHEMNEAVDYFILSESIYTHSGKPKPLHYEENKERFAQFNHKIIHVVVNDMPHLSNNHRHASMKRQRYQRNCISAVLPDLPLKDKDLIIFSDVDEIVNIESVKSFVHSDKFNEQQKHGITMRAFFYNFLYERSKPWTAARLFTYKFFKGCGFSLSRLRMGSSILAGSPWRRRKYCVPDGGWHCGWFGDISFIKNKSESLGDHGLFKNCTKEYIQQNIEKGFFVKGSAGNEQVVLHKVLPEGLPKYKDLILNAQYKNE